MNCDPNIWAKCFRLREGHSTQEVERKKMHCFGLSFVNKTNKEDWPCTWLVAYSHAIPFVFVLRMFRSKLTLQRGFLVWLMNHTSFRFSLEFEVFLFSSPSHSHVLKLRLRFNYTSILYGSHLFVLNRLLFSLSNDQMNCVPNETESSPSSTQYVNCVCSFKF